jgi:toxin ParE1/3/4
MKVRFTREATGDLHDISAYLRPRNPRAAKSVRQAIRRSAKVIGDFPEFGRAQAEDEVRKFVVSRYGYLIYYSINLSDRAVDILAIRHPSRERPYTDT